MRVSITEGEHYYGELIFMCKQMIVTYSECDRIQLKAMVADSFMTSPSWPVRTRSPLPAILLASTTSTSQPKDVHARPIATPILPMRSLRALS